MTNEVLQKIASDEQNISSSNGLEPSLRFTGFYENWHEKYIKDVADVIGGGTPDTTKLEYWNGNIQWFTPTEIGHNKYVNKSKRTITEKGLKNSSAKLLPPKTILLTSRATIGECSIIEKECATNQGFQSLVPNSLINNEFCYYLINTKKKELLRKASGSTFLEISNSEIKQIKCKFPSLLEQQKIADFLFLVDRRIEKQRQLVESLKKYKRGYFQRIISSLETSSYELKNIVDEYNAKSKIQNELPILSSTLSGIKLQNDYFNKQAASETTIGYKIVPFGYFTYRSMSDTGEFRFNLQNIIEKGIVSPAYPVFKVKEEYNAEFVEYILNETDKIKSQLLVKKEGGTRYALSFSKFQTLKIDLPTKSVQDKMVSQLRYANKILTNEEGVLSNLQKLKNGLLQQMFI